MWWLLALPVVGVLGAAAAASAKQRQAAATGAASGAAANTASNTAGPAPGATTSQGQPTAGTQAQAGQLSQADMLNLVTVALASGNPQRMREAAAQIRPQYPNQAQQLEAAAQATEQAIAAAGGQPATPATPTTPATPAQTMTLNEVITLFGAAMASGNPQTMRDAATKLRAAGYAQQAAQLETAANVAQTMHPATPTPTTPATPPTPTTPATPPTPTTPATPPTPTMTTNDAMTLFNAAMASQNVNTMRQASDKLRANGFVAQANILDAAITAASVIHPPPAPPTPAPPTPAPPTPAPPTPAPPTPAPPTPPPAPGMTQSQATALSTAALTSGNPTTMRQAAAQLRSAGYVNEATALETAATVAEAARNIPAPAPPAPPTPAAPNQSGKDLAARLTLALKTAKKGTSSEPKALVQQFQTEERLSRTDGSYGSETGIAIADRYGIVPAKPLYWGKKGGSYATLVADKNAYKAHLLNLAAKDPQRADEWRSAAAV